MGTIQDLEPSNSPSMKNIRTHHEKRLSSFLLTLTPFEGITLSRDNSPLHSPKGSKIMHTNTELDLLDQPANYSQQTISDSDDDDNDEESKDIIEAISASSAFEEDEDEDFLKFKKSDTEPPVVDKKKKPAPTPERKSFTFSVSKYFNKFKGIVGGIIRRKNLDNESDDEGESGGSNANKKDSYLSTPITTIKEEENPEAFSTVVPGLQETEIDSIDIEASVMY